MDMNTPGERLGIFRKSERLSQGELGLKVGLNKTQIRDMESGKVNISASRAILLQERLGLKKEWLLYGQGDMTASPAKDPAGDQITLRDLLNLHQEIHKLAAEIGDIKTRMIDAAQTGDLKRLGILGGKGN